LNKEDTNNTNRLTASNEIEMVIMFFSRKTHDQKHSPLNYIRPCKEELTVMLKLCHKIPKEATNTNSFDENRVNKTG
jgi:hypothetical protein